MSRAHVVGARDLSSLRDLELLARTTVEGLRQGLHRSPFHGYSAEFSQYRHYRPGDDLKYVDWKAFGRTDRLYSRQFRETTNLTTLFVIDSSRSMGYPGFAVDDRYGAASSAESGSKFDLARSAAAVLAALVIDQGDAAGILTVSGDADARAHYVAARSGRHHLHVLLAALTKLTCEGSQSIGAVLARAGALLPRRALVVVLSDFYEEERALSEVRRLARMGHDLVIIHVMARDELSLPAGGAVEFEDLETGAVVVTNASAVTAAYAESVGAFMTRVRQAVQREGLDYLRLVTGEALEPALRRFLLARRGGA